MIHVMHGAIILTKVHLNDILDGLHEPLSLIPQRNWYGVPLPLLKEELKTRYVDVVRRSTLLNVFWLSSAHHCRFPAFKFEANARARKKNDFERGD